MSSPGSNHSEHIDGLLMECIEPPATKWVERIDAICATKPELAGELRRRFDKLVALGIIDAPDTPAQPGPERLGHYRLLRRIGGGGMARPAIVSVPLKPKSLAVAVDAVTVTLPSVSAV